MWELVWPIQAGSWHQVPVPRGLRGLCNDQPAKDFIPAGAEPLDLATQNESMDSEHSICICCIHIASIPLQNMTILCYRNIEVSNHFLILLAGVIHKIATLSSDMFDMSHVILLQ